MTNPNNITKETYTNLYSGSEQTFTLEYSYEYNSSGFPVSVNTLNYVYGE